MYSFDIVVGLNFGILEEGQLKAITAVMVNSDYKNDIASPGLVIFSKKGSQLVVNPNQYILNIQLDDNPNFEKVNSLLIESLKSLKIGHNISKITCRITNVLGNNEKNAGEILNTYTNFNFDDIPGIKVENVAYRFITNNNGVIGEYKVEPLLADTKELFLEGIYNYNDVIVDDISNISIPSYNDFIEKQVYFTKQI